MSTVSVAGNIEMAFRLAGGARCMTEQAVRTALDRFSVSSVASRTVSQLSGGEFRRTALAATFVHEPEVALLDEPDAGLDAAGRAALERVLRDTLDRGGAVVMTAHTVDPSSMLPAGRSSEAVTLP